MAYVIDDNCIACGTCAPVCPVEAISEGDKYYVYFLDYGYTNTGSSFSRIRNHRSFGKFIINFYCYFIFYAYWY